MSRTPSQQCGHTTPPDRPHIDPVSRSHHPAQQIPLAYHQPYPLYEPRHFVPPDLGYERPALTTPPNPRLPALGHLPERNADPRYMLSKDHGFMNRQSLPQTLPLRIQHQQQQQQQHHHHRHHGSPVADLRGYPSLTSYDERSSPMLSHGGDNVRHRLQTCDVESYHGSPSTTLASPIHSEKSPAAFVGSPPPISSASSSSAQHETRQPPRNSSYSMPRGFDKLLHHEPESSPDPPPRRPSTQSRYHLHVRQQPIAARACGAGDRDRRPVDPPPIVQILLTDFDPESQDDRDILQDPRFTVGCLLFPISDSTSWTPSSEAEAIQAAERDADGVARADDSFSTPLLSGKAFMSPFFVDADPDPNSAPTHPSSDDNLHPLNSPSTHQQAQPPSLRNASKLNQPATFFIFADLSIRSAGLYRLQFRLMNWGSVEDTGQSMPILAEAWSDPFRVYAAKDFPGMRDSSILAEGLKELGFVELKTRGNGKGKGRKRG